MLHHACLALVYYPPKDLRDSVPDYLPIKVVDLPAWALIRVTTPNATPPPFNTTIRERLAEIVPGVPRAGRNETDQSMVCRSI